MKRFLPNAFALERLVIGFDYAVLLGRVPMASRFVDQSADEARMQGAARLIIIPNGSSDRTNTR
jgi:hypothetical protein